ncbi:MAG: SUMF1/EgtB/PvdO family nonheme iron enzyme [Hydrococcus sp. Prado102]|jgi:formylglycine-generating enzyme required for sulfatase activity|nr:SUMF1/EgtB/PvdO family nonheme iron enzyme [Hydrococcus sp. Prado102]
MPRCPVCQNRYVLGKDKHCPNCDWDFQSYPFFIGMIPEVAQKENTRLAWAVKLWSAFKSNQEQLKEANKTKLEFQSELEQNYQQQSLLGQASRQQEARLAQLQEQLNRDRSDLAQLRAEIERLKQNKTISDVTSSPPKVQIPQTKPALAPTELPSEPVGIQELNFQVAIVEPQERPVSHETATARYFSEDLGNGVFLNLVCLPGGTLLMGSPENEAGRESHEDPQHSVEIQPFALSQFPITQAQWQAIAHLPQIDRPLNPDPSNFKAPNLPVEQVSWYDAVEFCARLARLTKRDYRLPSEAEWEYACRAGTTTPFHFGETISSDLANYDGSYTYSFEAEGQYRQQTTPVGSFGVANAFGLYDMHGNVWEWCADSWHEDYRDAPSDGSIWQSDSSDSRRVLRGGSWYCLPNLCRSAQRHWEQADYGGSGTSFRVACSVPTSFKK